MNRSCKSLRIAVQLPLLFGGLWLLLDPLRAQEGLQPAEPLKGAEESQLRSLQSGKAEAITDADRKLIDKAAKFYANRLTWPRYQGREEEGDKSGDKKTMYQITEEALRQIVVADSPTKKLTPTQEEYQKEFGKAMSRYMQKVVRNREPITRINAARILAQLARAGSEECADLLLEVLKDPNENDGVKLWAIRGLRELFNVKQPTPKRESAYIQALLETLEARCTVKKDEIARKTPDELAADRYVRREVIRALGETRHPVLVDGGKVGSASWWLLRIARKDRISPEPSLSEQIEAAVGVCQLQPKLAKDYHLDYVAHQLGWFIVEYVGASNNKNVLQPPNSSTGVAWKAQAARLAQALDDLQAGAGKEPSVAEMVKLAKAALAPIEAGGRPGDPGPLERWLQANPPKNTVVLKAVPESVIKIKMGGGK